jgi:hypothetical protein
MTIPEQAELLRRASDVLANTANRGDTGPHNLISDMVAYIAAQPLVGVERAAPPLRAREEIARALYKSRGQFDDATVNLHFDWYLAQQGKPLAVRENPDARMAIVHCYRDADAVLALSSTAGQEWRDISSEPNDGKFRFYGLHVQHDGLGRVFEAHYIAMDEDGQLILPGGDNFDDWHFTDFEVWCDAPPVAEPIVAEEQTEPK